MLYVHKLNQLTVKSAEVESVYLIRELKQKASFPLQEKHFTSIFQEFFISPTDKNLMEQAISLLPLTIEKIEMISTEKNPLHESFNLQRSVQILKEMPAALTNNLHYTQEISEWQNGAFIPDTVALLNIIPRLRTKEEKVGHNTRLNTPFQKILRNTDFAFRSNDIVNEGHVTAIQGLSESMNKGFFFHFSLEEELRKVDFNSLKLRLPAAKITEAEEIRGDIQILQKGIERAYDVNMRMVNKALVLYAAVKWMNQGQA